MTATARQFDALGKEREKCDECGGPVTHPPRHGRPRRYCDDDCAESGRLKRKREWHQRLRDEERELKERIARLERHAWGSSGVPA